MPERKAHMVSVMQNLELGAEEYDFAPVTTPEDVRSGAVAVDWAVDANYRKTGNELALFASHMVRSHPRVYVSVAADRVPRPATRVPTLALRPLPSGAPPARTDAVDNADASQRRVRTCMHACVCVCLWERV